MVRRQITFFKKHHRVDLIRLDHTVAIYEALPNAELAVFPNSTHLAPYDDPQMFNATVERFLRRRSRR